MTGVRTRTRSSLRTLFAWTVTKTSASFFGMLIDVFLVNYV